MSTASKSGSPKSDKVAVKASENDAAKKEAKAAAKETKKDAKADSKEAKKDAKPAAATNGDARPASGRGGRAAPAAAEADARPASGRSGRGGRAKPADASASGEAPKSGRNSRNADAAASTEAAKSGRRGRGNTEKPADASASAEAPKSGRNSRNGPKKDAAADSTEAPKSGRNSRNGPKKDAAADSTEAPKSGRNSRNKKPADAAASVEEPKNGRRNRGRGGAKKDGAADGAAASTEAREPRQRNILSHPLIADSIADLIGRTPLLRLSKKINTTEANILLKLESENPMASVKDRLAYSIIKNAEKDGKIKPGDTLVEATSGNTGVALAQLGAALGYKTIMVMPETASLERRALIRLFGAKLILTPAKYGIKGSNQLVEKIVANTPGAYATNQFGTEYNAKVHRETTGPEIWQQTRGKVAAFIAGSGTGGTVTGVAEFFQGKKADTKIFVVEPEESQVIAGKAHSPHKIQGIGPGFVPEVLKKELITETIPINSDTAISQSRALNQTEGLFVGFSAGAAVAAALQVGAREEFKGKNVVVIIPSFGERYLSTALFQGVVDEVKAQAIVDPTEEGIEKRI